MPLPTACLERGNRPYLPVKVLLRCSGSIGDEGEVLPVWSFFIGWQAGFWHEEFDSFGDSIKRVGLNLGRRASLSGHHLQICAFPESFIPYIGQRLGKRHARQIRTTFKSVLEDSVE